MQFAAVAPPEDVFRIQEGFPVAGITSPDRAFPETADHLFAGKVAPAVLDVPLIGDLVQHNRLAVPLPPLVGVLRSAVKILPLNAAVGDPGTGVVVKGNAVMDGPEMTVRIVPYQQIRVVFPVLLRFGFQQVIFVREAPPDVAEGRKAGNDIAPVEVVRFPGHAGKAPTVIGMHNDQVRLNSNILKRQNAFFQMLKMSRVRTGEVEMVALRFSGKLPEVFLCQYGGIHRRPLKGIGARLPQVVIVMLGQDAEPDFVEACLLQGTERLLNAAVRLLGPDVTGGSEGIKRGAVRVSKVMLPGNTDRTVIAGRRFHDREEAGGFRFREGTGHGIAIDPGEGRHKADLPDPVSVIKAGNGNVFLFPGEPAPDFIIRERIAPGPARKGKLQQAPSFNCQLFHVFPLPENRRQRCFHRFIFRRTDCFSSAPIIA